MAYLRSNSDIIVGQERAIALLSRYISSDSIPSALLFIGENGIGKMKLAVEFARAINCENPSEGRDIGAVCNCRSCTLIKQSNHPSVTILDEKYQNSISASLSKKVSTNTDSTGIDAIRAIQKALSLKITYGRKNVVIVDSAQNLTGDAADAFLKTLEEPSSDVVLILLTTTAQALPRTIISRCQKVFFRRLKVDEIIEIVKKLRPEIKEFDKDMIKIFSATGSAGRSIKIIDEKEHYRSLEVKFRTMDIAPTDFKSDKEMKNFIEYLSYIARDSFILNPDQNIHTREAILDALRLLSSGVNRNMVLARLHAKFYIDKE